MLVTPNRVRDLGYDFTHTAAEGVSRNWSVLLLPGAQRSR